MSLQSPAERDLLQFLTTDLQGRSGKRRVLDIGANLSTVVERHLASHGVSFTADRLDIVPCAIAETHPWLGQSMVGSVEDMKQIESASYDAAFTNFVLEHVEKINEAAKEIFRILKPGGTFIASIPNPQSPEFLLSHRTPHWFHQFIRGYEGDHEHEAHHTHYSYKNINDFIQRFTKAGFVHEKTSLHATTYAYLHRFPIVNLASKLYDKLVDVSPLTALKGAGCIVFTKK